MGALEEGAGSGRRCIRGTAQVWRWGSGGTGARTHPSPKKSVKKLFLDGDTNKDVRDNSETKTLKNVNRKSAQLKIVDRRRMIKVLLPLQAGQRMLFWFLGTFIYVLSNDRQCIWIGILSYRL